MRKALALAFALTLAPAAVSAQTFEKHNYTYSEWTKGLFSEAVTVALSQRPRRVDRIMTSFSSLVCMMLHVSATTNSLLRDRLFDPPGRTS